MNKFRSSSDQVEIKLTHPSYTLTHYQVAKQWFDYDRSTYKFIREVKEGGSLKFTNTSDFDENGIIYWIGTNGRYVQTTLLFLSADLLFFRNLQP